MILFGELELCDDVLDVKGCGGIGWRYCWRILLVGVFKRCGSSSCSFFFCATFLFRLILIFNWCSCGNCSRGTGTSTSVNRYSFFIRIYFARIVSYNKISNKNLGTLVESVLHVFVCLCATLFKILLERFNKLVVLIDLFLKEFVCSLIENEWTQRFGDLF